MEAGREELAAGYRGDLAPLVRYLPWLEQSANRQVASIYGDQSIGENSLPFPVYDGTLLSFVKEAAAGPFMDRNYRYLYTRRGISSFDQERAEIEKAQLEDWSVLSGILSRYVLGGMTKASLWEEAVRERIFYLVIARMKDITEYWQ